MGRWLPMKCRIRYIVASVLAPRSGAIVNPSNSPLLNSRGRTGPQY